MKKHKLYIMIFIQLDPANSPVQFKAYGPRQPLNLSFDPSATNRPRFFSPGQDSKIAAFWNS